MPRLSRYLINWVPLPTDGVPLMGHKKNKASRTPKAQRDPAATQSADLARQTQARQHRKARIVGAILLSVAAITAAVTFILLAWFF